MKITIERRIAAPVDAVWRAWTTPEDIVRWNAASDDWHTVRASVDLREGGTFTSRMEAKDGSMGFDFEGTYTNVEPQRRLEATFGDRALVVEFEPGPDGTMVRETFDAETVFPIEQQRGGWQAILDNFARHVEQGGMARTTGAWMTPLFAKLDLGANAVIHVLGAPDSFEPELAALGRAGFEPVRQVAIDEDCSALRFRRIETIASMKRHADGALTAAGRAKAAAQRGR